MTNATPDATATDGATLTAAPAPAAGLGIERGGYIALSTADPVAAAEFAARHLGFTLVHADGEGRQYLAAQGLDPFSLVYVPGPEGIDHVSYVVRDVAAVERAAATLEAAGVPYDRVAPAAVWRTGPALRVQSPAGHIVQIAPGVMTDAPMAAKVLPGEGVPAPICFDHVAPRIIDVEAEMEFASTVLGLKRSARVLAPDGVPLLAFYRAHTLFHCYTIVQGPYNGLHHYQFSLKNAPAVKEAYARIAEEGVVEVVWGPLRHGPGHNVAFYVRDYAGNFIEYSAEEEIIPDDAGYIAQDWSATDPKFADEWGSAPPAVFFE